ncbi:unnamed protein product [Fraxinus pennsylvanica]|uniref:Glycine-rich protein n=1 Tax=Fraxinus pennsylvanica TaxID=56036 RepID=A0AAD2E608_9LAMI|nr:unnamed protein product [Fraxinus pennsylvanica]
MGSKTILLIGLLAMVLLISSEVLARELSQTSTNKEAEKTNGVEEAKNRGGGFGVLFGGGYPGGGYGGYPGGGYPGGGYGGYPGGGYPGGGYGGYPGGGYPGGRYGGGWGYCRYGCCGPSYYPNWGCRCCRYAGKAVDAKLHN